MSIFKNLIGIREIKSPVFYKEFKEENRELCDLLDLKEKVKSNKVKNIQRDIEFLEYVIQGERNVYSEINNSSIPMICLHDIRIQDGDYTAELDFILITTRFIMILETKKLNGDIYIDEVGEFVRYIKNKDGKIIDRKDVYSPILQNNRNVKMVTELLIKERIIKKVPILSGVIISNEKSIVNRSKAPKKVKYEIFRCDELADFINRKLSCYSKDKKMFEGQMKKIADFFITNNNEMKYDCYEKYDLSELDFIDEKIDSKSIIEDAKYEPEEASIVENGQDESINKEKSYEQLVREFKDYRIYKAKEENIKQHFIYSDEMIEEIIKLKPDNKRKLIQIRGFGPTKIDKYGQDIIDILS